MMKKDFVLAAAVEKMFEKVPEGGNAVAQRGG